MEIEYDGCKHKIGCCYKEKIDSDVFMVVYDEDDQLNKYKFVNLRKGFVAAKYTSMDDLDNWNLQDVLINAKMIIS